MYTSGDTLDPTVSLIYPHLYLEYLGMHDELMENQTGINQPYSGFSEALLGENNLQERE